MNIMFYLRSAVDLLLREQVPVEIPAAFSSSICAGRIAGSRIIMELLGCENDPVHKVKRSP